MDGGQTYDMNLFPPFAISARLAPAIRIGDAWLSYDAGRFVIDLPDGTEYVITDYRPGCHADLQRQFSDVLSFLGACAESRAYGRRVDGDPMGGCSSNLFPDNVGEWAEANVDEISTLQCEIEENENLIT